MKLVKCHCSLSSVGINQSSRAENKSGEALDRRPNQFAETRWTNKVLQRPEGLRLKVVPCSVQIDEAAEWPRHISIEIKNAPRNFLPVGTVHDLHCCLDHDATTVRRALVEHVVRVHNYDPRLWVVHASRRQSGSLQPT